MRLPSRVGTVAVAAGTLAGVLAPAAAHAASSTVPVSGNVPSFATAAHRVGSVSTAAHLTVSVYLTPRSAATMRSLVHDVSTPGSARYHHYLTPAQFHTQFSPSDTDVRAVTSFLSGAGLKVGSVASNRMYVDATGTVAKVEKAFHVTQALYTVQGQSIRSNAEAPQIPSSLAGKVAFVGGLDASQLLAHPSAAPRAAPPAPIAPALPCNDDAQTNTVTFTPDAHQYGSTLPFPECGYTPQQIRAVYGLPADWTQSQYTGKGITVGVVDAFASPTQPGDLDTFSKAHGLPSGSDLDFTQLVVPGTFNFPENHLDAQNWYGEEALDLVAVHSMAPEAAIVYVGAVNNLIPLDHALEALIDSHRADVITNSWGYNGEPNAPGLIRAEQYAFMQAALEGITVLFSSGDDGDVGAITGLAQASWPASSDFVTAVGGTTVVPGSHVTYGWGTYFSNFTNATLTGTAPSWTLTADSLPWPPGFLFGSGGGASVHVPQPDYQQGKVGTLGDSAATYDANGPSGTISYSTPRRVVPDLSMDGDPYTGLLVGESFTVSTFDPNNLNQDGSPCTKTGANTEYCETDIGGTSLASPLTAGVVALVDEARGGDDVGFLNPTIYADPTGLTDVHAPTSPLGFVRTRQVSTGNGLSARVVTVNSTVTDATSAPTYGADTTLRTTDGYDNVTGLGTPYVPAFINALS